MKPAHLTALAMTLLVRLWIDGVLMDADFLDYNTLGTNLKVWGDDAGGPHGQWSSSVYHRYTITDLYDYKLPLLSRVMPRFGKTIG